MLDDELTVWLDGEDEDDEFIELKELLLLLDVLETDDDEELMLDVELDDVRTHLSHVLIVEEEDEDSPGGCIRESSWAALKLSWTSYLLHESGGQRWAMLLPMYTYCVPGHASLISGVVSNDRSTWMFPIRSFLMVSAYAMHILWAASSPPPTPPDFT